MIRLLLRALWWGLGVPLMVLLLAWLPFNLPFADAAPRPTAPELALPQKKLPDDRNAALAVRGLMAEAGRDPLATGRALWAAESALWAQGAWPSAEAQAAGQAKRQELLGKEIAAPQGGPLVCTGAREDCTDEWFANVEGLARQRQSLGVLGERCDRIFGAPFEFEERLPPSLAPDAPVPSWAPLAHCASWFRSGAVIALARGQRDKAIEQLRHADRLHRVAWEGSHSPRAVMVTTRLARSTYDTMAAVALRDPALAEPLAALLAPTLDTRAAVRRWMPVEAASRRALVDHLGRGGHIVELGAWTVEYPADGQVQGAFLVAMDRAARHGIGLLPELTKQRIDTAWKLQLATLQYPWPAVLAGARVWRQAEERRSFWSQLRWRNTFGEVLADPAFEKVAEPYFARGADHELHREAAALVLALQRQRTPAAQRADVARRLAGDPLKERMSWSPDGRTLNVRTWQAEVPGAGYVERRDAIRFTWP